MLGSASFSRLMADCCLLVKLRVFEVLGRAGEVFFSQALALLALAFAESHEEENAEGAEDDYGGNDDRDDDSC